MSDSDLFLSDSDTEEKSATSSTSTKAKNNNFNEQDEELYDSDDDPEFDLCSYARKRKESLSDEEEEVVVIGEHARKRRAVDQQPIRSHWDVEGGSGDDAEAGGSESSQDGIECISLVEEDDNDESDVSDHECIRHVEEEDGSDVSDYEALKERCLRVLHAAQLKASGPRKQNLARKLAEIRETKTPGEVQAGYMAKIDRLKEEISSVEHQMNNEVAQNRAYWRVSTINIPELDKKSPVGLQKLPKESGHRLFSCPLVYCAAQVKNLSRHLLRSHGMADSDARKDILTACGQQTLQSRKRCWVCDKVLKRIDTHLVYAHGIDRGTARFEDVMKRSPCVRREGETEDPTKLRCQQLRSTEEDCLKQLLEAFRAHLESSLRLSPSTVLLNLRVMDELIKHSFSGQKDENFDGQALIRTLSTLGDPKSFLRRRGDSLSGSYCCTIIGACIRFLGLLRDQRTAERFHVDSELAQETEDSLRSLLKRYEKKKKAEKASLCELNESTMLSPEEIDRLLTSSAVKAVLESAADSLDREELRPVTLSGYVSLRNALIMSILVRSLRRPKEFIEFTVGEWKARTASQQGKQRLVKVKKLYGRGDIVLSPVEERAMQAFMLYARPLITRCNREPCPVFVSAIASGRRSECCVKMHNSTVTTLIKRMAIKAGVTARAVNTRVIRRSTITAAWNNVDPAFMQEMSQVVCLSIDTSEQRRQAVKELKQCR